MNSSQVIYGIQFVFNAVCFVGGSYIVYLCILFLYTISMSNNVHDGGDKWNRSKTILKHLTTGFYSSSCCWTFSFLKHFFVFFSFFAWQFHYLGPNLKNTYFVSYAGHFSYYGNIVAGLYLFGFALLIF